MESRMEDATKPSKVNQAKMDEFSQMRMHAEARVRMDCCTNER